MMRQFAFFIFIYTFSLPAIHAQQVFEVIPKYVKRTSNYEGRISSKILTFKDFDEDIHYYYSEGLFTYGKSIYKSTLGLGQSDIKNADKCSDFGESWTTWKYKNWTSYKCECTPCYYYRIETYEGDATLPCEIEVFNYKYNYTVYHRYKYYYQNDRVVKIRHFVKPHMDVSPSDPKGYRAFQYVDEVHLKYTNEGHILSEHYFRDNGTELYRKVEFVYDSTNPKKVNQVIFTSYSTSTDTETYDLMY